MTVVGENEIHTVAFSAYGVRISVASNHKDDIDSFRKELEFSFPSRSTKIDPSTADYRFFLERNRFGKDRLLKNGETVSEQIFSEDLFRNLVSFARLTVAEFAREFVFVHAAVVGWNGKAVLIPGHSRSGKTTLTAELLRTGATYFSDEYAVIDHNADVHPFPKPLSIRRNGGDNQQIERPAQDFGLVATSPAQPAVVIITKYSEMGVWKPRTLTAGEGVIELMKDTIPVRVNPTLTLQVLAKVTQKAKIFKSPRGDTRAHIDLIVKLLEKHCS